MIIALSNPIGKKFNPNYFGPENFGHELFSPHGAAKTDLMDPQKVLEDLGLNSNYLEEPPFCYIRSYASIWEYYLIALNASHNTSLQITKTIYDDLSGTPYKKKEWISLGSGRAVGNADFEDWKKNYQRFSGITKESEKKRIEELAKQSEDFSEMLLNRRCPIRQCRKEEYANPEKHKFIKSRRKAAKAFTSFLLNNGETFSEDDADVLVQKKGIYDKLIWLLDFFSKKPECVESYKHVLSASLLLSLYGYKGAILGKAFVRTVIKHIKSFSKQSTQRDVVCRLLDRGVEDAKGVEVYPPLAIIYKERDRLLLTLRISSWLHLLEGVLNAQRQ